MSSTHSLNLLINTANLQTSKLVLQKLMSNQSSADEVALLEMKMLALHTPTYVSWLIFTKRGAE